MSVSQEQSVESRALAPPRVVGLDALRFLAALVVALAHGAGPSFPTNLGSGQAIRLLEGLYNNLWNGPAAVIIFFIISGFCIHYPYARGAPFAVRPFLVRRIIRIAGPLIAIAVLAALLGQEPAGALRLVVWSLYCEIIYYLLYPAFQFVFARIGIRAFTIAAFVVSLGLIVGFWNFRYYWNFPIYWMWLVTLPAWLLGTLLAEHQPSPRTTLLPQLLLLRAATWGYSIAATAYFFHGPGKIGHPALLTPFCLLVFVWLDQELRYRSAAPTSRILEWCGKWSYSLYLTHPVVLAFTGMAFPDVGWLARLGAVLTAALLFYWLVEAPFHSVARSASRFTLRRNTPRHD